MTKAILSLFCFFVLNGLLFGQVIADFEVDENGFGIAYGDGLTSVSQVADPTSQSGGVLALDYDGKNTAGTKGAAAIGNVDANGAQVFTFYVYLPAGTPDGLDLKLYSQDAGSWTWNDFLYKSEDIPKEVWYPISFFMEQRYVNDPASYNHHDNLLGALGIEVANWDMVDPSWSGTIYLDNITVVGAEPTVFGDFETDESGFADNGWGTGFTSVSQTADPTSATAGVLALEFNGNDKGAIQIDNVDPSGNDMIGYWLYLPADIGDSVEFKLWAQDDGNWAWTEKLYHAVDIPKEKWYPIYYDMAAMTADPNAAFDHNANKIGKMGIEIADWTGNNWAGMIYIDNASFVGSETGDKWVLADFESPAGGTYEFSFASWAPATTNLAHAEDPTGESAGVLELSLDFAAASDNPKGFIQRGGLLFVSEGDTATDVTIDVWIPEDCPLGAELGAVLNGPATGDQWTEIKHFLNDTMVVRGQWNTINVGLSDLITAGTVVDPTLSASFGVQFYHPMAENWIGKVYFDNYTVHGLKQPEGELQSPPLTLSTAVDTSENGQMYEVVVMNWVDNTLGNETYNIYMSESNITALDAPDVMRVASGIPHGLQGYGQRVFTKDGGDVEVHYAITATDGIEETDLTGSNTGSITVNSSSTFKVKYDATFASKFSLDGLNTEWADYHANDVSPESAGGDAADAWAPGSSDLDFKVSMVIDDEYLYISADVTDDDLRVDTLQQAWEGDALEFYMGFYDAYALSAWHKKNFEEGDWRIGFNALGKTTLGGGSPITVPGIESTVFQKFTGDGYIIEARLTLDSLGVGNNVDVYDGMRMPFKVDNNDWDPTMGDEARSLIIQAGGPMVPEHADVDLDQDWLRPHTWGFLEVIDGPQTDVEDLGGAVLDYKLYNNYPNPFNPSTSIKYDLRDESAVSVKVFDILGREVAVLVNETQKAGSYKVNFNASSLASGVYIYTIKAGNFTANKKMMLLK